AVRGPRRAGHGEATDDELYRAGRPERDLKVALSARAAELGFEGGTARPRALSERAAQPRVAILVESAGFGEFFRPVAQIGAGRFPGAGRLLQRTGQARLAILLYDIAVPAGCIGGRVRRALAGGVGRAAAVGRSTSAVR